MEEIVDKAKTGAKKGFAALREPEGLATAALGAFLFNPVVGIALGIGQGILARRGRESALDDAAAEREMLASMNELHHQAMTEVQGLASTDLDRAQLEQLGKDYKVLQTLALSPDPQTRQSAILKMAEASQRVGSWLEDLEGRNETVMDQNISLLDEQGVVARQNFERGLSQAQSVQRVSSEMHTLLNDPSFDPNNPVARARLGQLLEQTPREFLADPADMSDALQNVGANVPGIMGGLVQYYAGKKKAEEFTFTKEDWRKIAFAMAGASKAQAERTMADSERIGVMLDRAAGGIGHKPALSYLDRIMTGEVQDGEQLVGRPGVYDEVTRKAAEERAASAAAREALEPSKTSKAVSVAKEKAKTVVGRFLELTGWTKEEPAPSRRPTN